MVLTVAPAHLRQVVADTCTQRLGPDRVLLKTRQRMLPWRGVKRGRRGDPGRV